MYKEIDEKHFCTDKCNQKLKRWELSLVFQEIISSTWKITFEILVRLWDELKSFEPIFQKSCINTMREFDYKVFDLIFSQFDKYIERYSSIHINIFPFTLREHDFIEKFNWYLKKYNIQDTSKIHFEIIENWYVRFDENWELNKRNKDILQNLNKNIKVLQDLGIKVWLDDYPKGNSLILLMYLKNLNFIKIDKDYLLWNDIYQEKSKIIKKLILNINEYQDNPEIIVEWVENIEDKILLEEIWGVSMQWYYFWKPEKFSS